MDSLLVFTGLTLLLLAIVLLLCYLLIERGSILDPISVSWGGYIMFVVVGMLSTGLLYPSRSTDSVSTRGVALALLGTISYVVALYSGRGSGIVSRLPHPAPSLTKPQVWFMWAACAGGVALTFVTAPFVGEAVLKMYFGLFSGSLGAVVLLSLLAFFVFKRSPFTKLVMLASIAGTIVLTLNYYWSRRPLAGLILAGAGFIYRYKLSRASLAVRMALVGAIMTGLFFTLAFLTASRGYRFFGTAAGEAHGIWSRATLMRFVGGLEINYRAYEFTLEQFPQNHDYLYGKGYLTVILFPIPRALWRNKPLATGNLVSRLWYNTDDLPNTLGLPPMGELYANWGVLGIVIGMFIAGRVVRILNTYLRYYSSNLVLWLSWLMVLPDFATEWRGDFTSMTVQPFLRICVFIGLAWVAGRFVAARPEELVTLDPASARQNLDFRPPSLLISSGGSRPPA